MMAGHVEYPSFAYDRLLSFHPPGRASTVFYESLLRRFIDGMEPVDPGNPALDACWKWTGSRPFLNHKYISNVTLKHLCFAMGFPHDYNRYCAKYRRVRITTINRCMHDWCCRPDHVLPQQAAVVQAWGHRPIKRNPKKYRDDWLTYPEAEWLKAAMRCGSANPEFELTTFAERINLPYLTVLELWEQFKNNLEKEFIECSVLRS